MKAERNFGDVDRIRARRANSVNVTEIHPTTCYFLVEALLFAFVAAGWTLVARC
jgi:hypothetical protein